MQIGGFRFDLPAPEYSELSRRHQRRWAARERHGLPPALEDLGRDADSITLTGTVWVRTAADLDALAGLRADAGMDPDGEARPLTVFLGGGDMASGDHLGQWVVEHLEVRERDLRFGGVPARIDFTIRMREHVA